MCSSGGQNMVGHISRNTSFNMIHVIEIHAKQISSGLSSLIHISDKKILSIMFKELKILFIDILNVVNL